MREYWQLKVEALYPSLRRISLEEAMDFSLERLRDDDDDDDDRFHCHETEKNITTNFKNYSPD